MDGRTFEARFPTIEQFPGTNLNSRPQIGALLEARGWTPEQRTEKTKKPKIDDKILETIPATYPEFAGLADYLILGRRLAQLTHGDKAWRSHVDANGRIHGGLVHIGTPHSRAKHLNPNLAQVPNPKKGAPFSAECRGAVPARTTVGSASPPIKARCKTAASPTTCIASITAPTPKPSSRAKTPTGRPPAALGLIGNGTARNKDSKLDTALREGSKRFRYAFLYGAQAGKAGRIIYDTARAAHQIDAGNKLLQQFFGNSIRPNEASIRRVGGPARQKFLDAVPGLQTLLEKLQGHAKKHGWLYGLDGRRVPVRALYTALNFIVTSSEAIICKRWLVHVYDELNARFRYGWDGDCAIMLWVHDELVVCCRPEIAQEVGEILVKHAREPGEFYGFRVPLDADYKIGRSWAGDPLLPPLTRADLDAVNAGLVREGIEPIDTAAVVPPEPPAAQKSGANPKPEPAPSFPAEPEEAPLPPLPPPPSGNGYDADNTDYSGRPIERYVYTDERGALHARKIRTDGKKFWQERREGDHWVKGGPDIRYLFGICELLAAPPDRPVWITEGEKDRNSLTALGLLAVTNPGGAGKWEVDFTAEQTERWFKGRQLVYLLEDNDAPGRKHVEVIGRALHRLVAKILVVSFRELPEKSDVTDWLTVGHDKAALLARANVSPTYCPPTLQTVLASEVVMTAVTWLWPSRFAIGKLGIIAGLPDEGKGVLLSFIAAKITTGSAWPCNEGVARLGKVLLFTAEDDANDTVVPRLAAAGADLTRNTIVNMVVEAGKDRMFSLQTDLEMLRRKLDEIGDVTTLLIDPISAYQGVGKVDSYRTNDVRAILGPLCALAAERRIAIIAIMHFNKKIDITNALIRISDSLAYAATARHCYGIINDPENRRKLMVRAKNNIAANTAAQTTLAFKFETRDVGTDLETGAPIVAPYAVFEPDYVDVTATEAMQAAGESKSPTARHDAKQFLKDLLAGDPVKMTEVLEIAKANCISLRSLERAKRELKVIADPVKNPETGVIDHWVWKLPPEE